MAEYITRIRTEVGDLQIDYNALANLPDPPTPKSIGAATAEHTHTQDEITDFPTSLPANGGNADTLDDKHASDFALATELKALETKINDASFDLTNITVTTEELNYINGVTDNVQTQLDAKAEAEHEHDASEITSGVITADRLPTTEMDKGGTGANDGATGLKNLFAAGSTVLSSYQYGDELPSAGMTGRLFFKKVID